MPGVVDGIARSMLAIELDEGGEWIAWLDCGHRRHLRHRPPLSSMPWLLDAAARAARVGQRIECGRCAQCEPPSSLRAGRLAAFDEHTLPAGLRAEHRLREGAWARLEIDAGELRFVMPMLAIDRVLGPGDAQWIPPAVEHHVAPGPTVRVRLSFFRVADRDPQQQLANSQQS